MDKRVLTEMLIQEESLEGKVYKCSAGKLTVGVGRNLEDVGISVDEAHYLLKNDIERVEMELARFYPLFYTLDNVRQTVLADMCFNLGIVRLSKFKRMWRALAKDDFTAASIEMMDSNWAEQVGVRAEKLALMMGPGECP